MSWLITGGAGYIGSHVARVFSEHGMHVIILDDLTDGHPEFIAEDAVFYRGTLRDRSLLSVIFTKNNIEGVVHMAGFKYAAISGQHPLHTYLQNVNGTVNLLSIMADSGVDNFVFSSSAAVYGTPDVELVTEDTEPKPETPFGETKLIGEWLLDDVGRARGLSHTSLRYFNVVGSGYPDLYDASHHSLFPTVFDALLEGRNPQINGDDYPTPDGTCVRDYVHVQDVALAHVAAAEKLLKGEQLQSTYNLGSGHGVSVGQIMNAVHKVTGIDFTPTVAPRRPGDPARIVASGELAQRDINWEMRHSLDDMVRTAWQARTRAEELEKQE